MSPIAIRQLRKEDLQSLWKIQEKITRKRVPRGWKEEISDYIRRNKDECLAAELEGKVVGFIIGEVKTLEFGLERSGWIVAIGVDPEFMGQGVGRKLGKELLGHFKRKRIREVYTAVRWDSSDLLTFFKSIGFERSEFINLERRL